MEQRDNQLERELTVAREQVTKLLAEVSDRSDRLAELEQQLEFANRDLELFERFTLGFVHSLDAEDQEPASPALSRLALLCNALECEAVFVVRYQDGKGGFAPVKELGEPPAAGLESLSTSELPVLLDAGRLEPVVLQPDPADPAATLTIPFSHHQETLVLTAFRRPVAAFARFDEPFSSYDLAVCRAVIGMGLLEE